MNRNQLWWFVAMLAGALSGCSPREQATLWVFSSADLDGGSAEDYACAVSSTSESTAPGTEAAPTLVRCPAAPLDEGAAYFLRHELPEGLHTIGTLQVRLETPCAAALRELEETHVDGRFLLPFTLPKGGSCAFLVTTVMAQSELSCSINRALSPGDGACSDLDTICASSSTP